MSGTATRPARLANVTLLVAQACNLRCGYCYADGGSYGAPAQRMAATTLKRALERLLPLAGPRLTLSFFGGEPLLNLPLLEAAVLLGRRLGETAGVEVRFALTTNGTLLEGRALEFVTRHVDFLAVSLDGEAAVTDRARRFRRGRGSVHARVCAGLERLRAAGVPFGLRATVTPESAPRLADSAGHLAGLGPVSLRLVPDFGATPWPEPALAALVAGFDTLHREALARALTGHVPLGGEALYPLLAHRVQGTVRERPCAAGEAVVAVAADGAVYPCDHFVGNAAFRMGCVHDGDFPGPEFARVQARLAANTVAARPACRACEASHLCGGECPAVAAAGGGGIAGADGAFCRFKRETTARLQALLDEVAPVGELPAPLCALVEG
ncbi:radical SAM/SPASM domain-containing protein [Thioalbus denitrificans]|uniref:Radical SAM core domain-containing protein n=1 Tax=Thioalbus denitrificans TaxID=547122 RepID=A0A369BXA8_9GAMM|nr:radical SAM protein [Thioalbus denitrificans]RCX26332.1 uncharacterized protein DFQ59_11042 [Thioalbus denitrificans]